MSTPRGSASGPALSRGALSVLFLLSMTLLLAACGTDPGALAAEGSAGAVSETVPVPSRVAAPTPEQAGRYLVMVGGCNDCHTPGFMERGYDVPEEEWLTGMAVGFRGPWGTSYASNLRLTARALSEDEWARMFRGRVGLPPMPWGP